MSVDYRSCVSSHMWADRCISFPRTCTLRPRVRRTTGAPYEVIILVLVLTTPMHARTLQRSLNAKRVDSLSRSTSLFRARGKRKRRGQPLKSRTRPVAIAGINILLRDYRRGVSHADDPRLRALGNP